MVEPAASPGAAPRRGRPPSRAKGEAVLEAATEVFLREGFAGTTVDAVAAASGVAKQTVYNRFGDKDALFRAVLAAARAAGRPEGLPAPGLVDAPDLRSALVEYGTVHLGLTMSPRVAALRRLMIGEIARRPDLRELWNDGGPAEAVTRLVAEFTALDRAGRLAVPDPDLAVRQLIALLAHEANRRSRYGADELTEPTRREIAAEAADMLLRAYRPG